ncbi:two-component system sensor histidine kinase NtrB [Tsuneonella aeria]|uniref:two-component system sensor histidine kinase NtrB n=1 Tax=Tsuneonella aeria TaxID=1837929 RepID=UPI00301D331C
MTAPGAPGPREQIAGLSFAVLLIDPDLTIVEANPASENMLGRSAPRLVSTALLEVFAFEDSRIAERIRDQLAPLVARDVAVRVGAAPRRVNLTLSPVPSHPGWRVLTLSEAPQDMVEPGNGTAQLSAPAVLAHEIKNPLAAIRGAGQLVARKLKPADRLLADLITGEVDRIASLIDRMQRIGARTSEPNAPFNLHEAVLSALAAVRGGDMAGVELVEAFDPSLPTVMGNRAGLEQIVINLVANARDAVEQQQGARVTVRTRYASGLSVNAAGPGRPVRLPIELTVSDNGPGIDADLRDHVFEPFVSSRAGGQGLGLALVRRLVRDMGGRVAHERDESAGLTHFRVHLPLAEGA